MKILIVSQYFWPESFKINDLALGLKERGHEVTIFTGKPNYPKGAFYEGYSFWKKADEYWEGIKIYRSNLLPRGKGGGLRLMANYLSFAFFASVKAFFQKGDFDAILVYEPSPITVGIPAIALGKKLKVPVYFWVQDLWPESISAAGQINNKLILNTANAITKWIYKHSKKVLIQSEAFTEYITNQGVPLEKLVYYPNSTESYYKPVMPSDEIKNLLPKDGFIVLFAGNIGECQDFETTVEAARLVIEKEKKIHFVILGDGRKKKFVEEQVSKYNLQNNFHLLGSFSSQTMPAFFACADALLVTLGDDRIFDLTIPSKVQSYLACGKAIIGSLNGEGAKVIETANAGVVAPAGHPEKLAAKILELFNTDPETRAKMGKEGRQFFNENFERELLLDRLVEILKK
ncbi:glycosyltransferase family 4 protein [Taibaiella lutea]|uniref:Glycosyltransferase family 4 protein n=1 Tax=Taibaiella lutea TaxID=2608001 RepID=A0A5M6CF76_9BACT|nr:glycosyltransferase family 4 protein [Taibaiella lutea]KAA5533781.1 glycosyltransferase family 4 protein [Taibaiella lutea]